MARGDTCVDSNVAAIDSTEDTVLEALRIFEIDIELAVLAVFGNRNTRADGRDVVIEFQGEPRDVVMSARGVLLSL